jgi:hypothetical protein
MVPLIEDGWDRLPRKIRQLEKIQKQPPATEDILLKETFLEFVEKLVMLDVLVDPYMSENFV